MKKAYVFACLLLLTATVAAQGFPLHIKVDGLNCTTSAGTNMFDALSWSWGTSSPAITGPGGIRAGKASISDLSIMKVFDACSPILFNEIGAGKVFSGLTLTQMDNENNIIFTLTLTNVVVEAQQFSGSNERPTESDSFNFEKVCIVDGSTSASACFDKTRGRAR
ncbi:MAG: type VI secretion system tube protein Hcp [Acidobacteriia bacterium]|nr:type VI secretion system tube protein Hcp [Terriglobia bacterium]